MDQYSQKSAPPFALFVTAAFVLTSTLTVLIMAGVMAIVVHFHLGGSLVELHMFQPLLIAAASALVISVSIGILFSRSIIGPIRRISQTADAIKKGDFSARTELMGDDEISHLAMTFDQMADAIERDRNLEQQLIGDVAHELRTPLMAIQSTVEAIQDGVFEADQERLSTLSAETRRLGRLVEGLLKLNRLERGSTEVHSEDVNVSEIADALFLSHQALVEDSGIMLTKDITADVWITGDSDLMRQAIANLLSNAVRYTQDGGSILIKVTREEGSACIAVTDTGLGISEENLNKVFSRFWRADEARHQSSGGLGIGLSLVKEITDQHNGHLRVQSVLGEGSTFFIFIPLGDADPSFETARSKRARMRAQRANKRAEERLRREHERQRKEMDRKNRQEAHVAAEKARMEAEEQARKERERRKKEEAKRKEELRRLEEEEKLLQRKAKYEKEKSREREAQRRRAHQQKKAAKAEAKKQHARSERRKRERKLQNIPQVQKNVGVAVKGITGMLFGRRNDANDATKTKNDSSSDKDTL